MEFPQVAENGYPQDLRTAVNLLLSLANRKLLVKIEDVDEPRVEQDDKVVVFILPKSAFGSGGTLIEVSGSLNGKRAIAKVYAEGAPIELPGDL